MKRSFSVGEGEIFWGEGSGGGREGGKRETREREVGVWGGGEQGVKTPCPPPLSSFVTINSSVNHSHATRVVFSTVVFLHTTWCLDLRLNLKGDKYKICMSLLNFNQLCIQKINWKEIKMSYRAAKAGLARDTQVKVDENLFNILITQMQMNSLQILLQINVFTHMDEFYEHHWQMFELTCFSVVSHFFEFMYVETLFLLCLYSIENFDHLKIIFVNCLCCKETCHHQTTCSQVSVPHNVCKDTWKKPMDLGFHWILLLPATTEEPDTSSDHAYTHPKCLKFSF